MNATLVVAFICYSLVLFKQKFFNYLIRLIYGIIIYIMRDQHEIISHKFTRYKKSNRKKY